MKRLVVALILLVTPATVSACGYDGWVRYPCQSPENWDRPDCQRPQCEVDGTCPDYLLPERVTRETDE